MVGAKNENREESPKDMMEKKKKKAPPPVCVSVVGGGKKIQSWFVALVICHPLSRKYMYIV